MTLYSSINDWGIHRLISMMESLVSTIFIHWACFEIFYFIWKWILFLIFLMKIINKTNFETIIINFLFNTYNQGSPMDRPPEGGGNLGGSSGSTEHPTSKKNSIFVSFRPFLIRLTKKIWKKPWFSQFCKFCWPSSGGIGGTTPTPYWRTLLITVNIRIKWRI